MSDLFNLRPDAVCVQYHEALKKDCPVCGAVAEECCIEDGEELPVYAAHIGRETGGVDLAVVHTGEYTEDGSGILKEVSN